LKAVSPTTAIFAAQKAAMDAQIRDLQRRVNAGEKPADNKQTIFHQLLDSNAADGHVVPPIEAMRDEAGVIVAAASDTVSVTLTMAFYRVLASDRVRETLMTELIAAFPDPEAEFKFEELEKRPYLTAVLKESLHLVFPLPGRLPRVVPDGGIDFDGYHIPAGMAVSMSQWIQHRNEVIFPDPMTFEPERWLSEAEKGTGWPEDYFIAFGRGSRVCLCITLAWCELYITLGTVMRRFGDSLKLYGGISEEDFYPFDDYMNFWLREDAKKLAVGGK
jgi:cytochrome P450